MALSKVRWKLDKKYRGNDIHLIRNGVEINIAPHLELIQTTGTLSHALNLLVPPAVRPGTVDATFDRIEFIPIWNGAAVADVFSLAGVTVHKKTGKIKASAHPGGANLNLRNFVVSIRAYKTDGSFLETKVRIHVHDSLTKAWLTPSPLTVRPDITGTRFSIYAQFADSIQTDATVYADTVGDISFHEGVTWASSSANVTVNADGLLTALPAGVGNMYKISCTLGASFGTVAVATPVDNVKVGDSWKTPTVPADRPFALFVPGGPGDADAIINKSPNYVLIAESYVAGEAGDFAAVAADAVAKASLIAHRPWDLILPQSNFWTIFVPSSLKGSSLLSEYLPLERKNAGVWEDKLYGVEEYIGRIEAYLRRDINSIVRTVNHGAQRAAAITGIELKLADLIAKVGFPVPADKAMAIADKRAEWRALFDPAITTYDQLNPPDSLPIVHVPEDLYNFWLLMADRRLINERDTALGLKFGGKPNINYSHHTRVSENFGVTIWKLRVINVLRSSA